MPAKRGKKVAQPPSDPKAKKSGAKKESRFEAKKLIYGVGGDLPRGKRDVSRYVRWPKYIRLQRQKKIITSRLKVPPAVNQFNNTVDKSTMAQFLRLAKKYKPETKAEKKERLMAAAQAQADGKAPASKKPCVLKYGLNHVTALVEQKKAQLVAIAADVDPLELIVWLPAVCRKMGVAYCIVKSKAVLGKLCNKKTAAVVALTSVRQEDKNELGNLVTAVKSNFNERHEEIRRKWGGGVMGIKSRHASEKKQKAIDMEARKKAGY